MSTLGVTLIVAGIVVALLWSAVLLRERPGMERTPIMQRVFRELGGRKQANGMTAAVLISAAFIAAIVWQIDPTLFEVYADRILVALGISTGAIMIEDSVRSRIRRRRPEDEGGD